MKLIHDVRPPVNDWERGYALLEFERMGLLGTFAKRIAVKRPIDVVFYDSELKAHYGYSNGVTRGVQFDVFDDHEAYRG
jgi:hypothetical protein